MSQNLGSLPPCHTMSHFVDPPPLTCDIIYGWPLITMKVLDSRSMWQRQTKFSVWSAVSLRCLGEWEQIFLNDYKFTFCVCRCVCAVVVDPITSRGGSGSETAVSISCNSVGVESAICCFWVSTHSIYLVLCITRLLPVRSFRKHISIACL